MNLIIHTIVVIFYININDLNQIKSLILFEITSNVLMNL